MRVSYKKTFTHIHIQFEFPTSCSSKSFRSHDIQVQVKSLKNKSDTCLVRHWDPAIWCRHASICGGAPLGGWPFHLWITSMCTACGGHHLRLKQRVMQWCSVDASFLYTSAPFFFAFFGGAFRVNSRHPYFWIELKIQKFNEDATCFFWLLSSNGVWLTKIANPICAHDTCLFGYAPKSHSCLWFWALVLVWWHTGRRSRSAKPAVKSKFSPSLGGLQIPKRDWTPQVVIMHMHGRLLYTCIANP